MIERCRRFAARRGHRVLLIFDGVDGAEGAPGALSEPPIEVSYAIGIPADDQIAFRAERSLEESRHISVVTDDLALRRRLSRRIAKVSTGEFWALTEPPKPPRPVKPPLELADVEAALLGSDAGAANAEARIGPARLRGNEPGIEARRRAAEGIPPTVPQAGRVAEPGSVLRAAATIGERVGRAGVKPETERAPDPDEARRIKKARGARKQARRLAGRASGRPRKRKIRR